jgi:hypothetical protein
MPFSVLRFRGRRTGEAAPPDPDLAASLFSRRELKTIRSKTRRSQTSLPPTVSHHGRWRRGGERPARGSRRGRLKKSKSPQGIYCIKTRAKRVVSYGDSQKNNLTY